MNPANHKRIINQCVQNFMIMFEGTKAFLWISFIKNALLGEIPIKMVNQAKVSVIALNTCLHKACAKLYKIL